MLFKRREPMNWKERTRVAIWPRRSWSRSISYLGKRVLRLTASPHAVAAGIAAGVFASCTPFVGFHFIIAFIVAYFLAGNMIAAATGTFVGNPATFPFMWGATYATGKFIIHGFNRVPNGAEKIEELHQISPTDFWSLGFSGMVQKFVGIWEPIVLPMAIGSVPIGILLAVLAYVLTRSAAVSFRHARMRRLEAKKRAAAGALADEEVTADEAADAESEEQPPAPGGAAARVEPDEEPASADRAAVVEEIESGPEPKGAEADEAAAPAPHPEEQAVDAGQGTKAPEPRARGRRKKPSAVAAGDDPAGSQSATKDAADSALHAPEPESGQDLAEQASLVEAVSAEEKK